MHLFNLSHHFFPLGSLVIVSYPHPVPYTQLSVVDELVRKLVILTMNIIFATIVIYMIQIILAICAPDRMPMLLDTVLSSYLSVLFTLLDVVLLEVGVLS